MKHWQISLEMISENCRQNGMFFLSGGGGKLVVNSDDMTTDQKDWGIYPQNRWGGVCL